MSASEDDVALNHRLVKINVVGKRMRPFCRCAFEDVSLDAGPGIENGAAPRGKGMYVAGRMRSAEQLTTRNSPCTSWLEPASGGPNGCSLFFPAHLRIPWFRSSIFTATNIPTDDSICDETGLARKILCLPLSDTNERILKISVTENQRRDS